MIGIVDKSNIRPDYLDGLLEDSITFNINKKKSKIRTFAAISTNENANQAQKLSRGKIIYLLIMVTLNC
ncbi:hypothetical protein Q73_13000 [Bacillus coahuilensis m2-6]|uniref:hypothetical protein n=1 Tax=Bacillus coahuilensis TaxID=408580 RepID=UPI0007505E47|nr:hypothetical protein [Bacillus coahuilensis]KUP05558.1 hypothetical protein Q73_13000 [Bacillus coahuilensis m2-6]